MDEPIKVVKFERETFEFRGSYGLLFCREEMEDFLYKVYGINVLIQTFWLSAFRRYGRDRFKVKISEDVHSCYIVEVEEGFDETVLLHRRTKSVLLKMFGLGTFYVGVEYIEA